MFHVKQFVIINEYVTRETMQNVTRETMQNVTRETTFSCLLPVGGLSRAVFLKKNKPPPCEKSKPPPCLVLANRRPVRSLNRRPVLY